MFNANDVINEFKKIEINGENKKEYRFVINLNNQHAEEYLFQIFKEVINDRLDSIMLFVKNDPKAVYPKTDKLVKCHFNAYKHIPAFGNKYYNIQFVFNRYGTYLCLWSFQIEAFGSKRKGCKYLTKKIAKEIIKSIPGSNIEEVIEIKPE